MGSLSGRIPLYGEEWAVHILLECLLISNFIRVHSDEQFKVLNVYKSILVEN